MKRTADSIHRIRAFTLLETMVTVAITTLLVLMTIWAFTSAMQASAITAGADMLRDSLKFGRTSAMAHNRTVEVRFYSTTSSSSGTPLYDAMQLHWIETDGTTPPVAHALLLSSWTVLDSTATYSSLLGANPQSPTPDPSDRLLNGSTRVFHYFADGTTDLNPASNWYLTLRPAGTARAAQLPSNYACIVVDAVSGRPQIYRP